MNRLLLKQLDKLETYIREKKEDKKICFHCESNEDFKNNIELVELFKNEMGQYNHFILIGYKGSIYIKKVDKKDYLHYKSIIDVNNDEFNQLKFFYCNNCNIEIVGLGSSDIILYLILYSIKIYLDIPFSEKDEAKKKGAKWCLLKKKWFIYRYNEYWDEFLNNYQITDYSLDFIKEYIELIIDT